MLYDRKTLAVLGLVVILHTNLFAAESRVWTTVDGQKVLAELAPRPTKSHVPLSVGGRTTKVPYNHLSTEDLVWLFKNYPYTEEPIRAVMEERLPPLVKSRRLEEVDQLGKDLPFMKAFIESALIEALKDSNLKTINEITVNFPGMRGSIAKVIAERLKNPTDKFLGIIMYEDSRNDDIYMEKKIAAYREITAKYPELKKNVVDAINIELLDETKDDYWKNLNLLSDLMASFPDTGPSVKEALLRSIRNPEHSEKDDGTARDMIFVDSFGVRFSSGEVMQELGGWFTKRGHHPVKPKEDYSIGIFNRARMEAIVTRWRVLAGPIEQTIVEELRNTARRWSWDELRELVKSFPGVQKEAEDFIVRDRNSPDPKLKDISYSEMLQSFPNLSDVILEWIRRDLLDPQKVFPPEELIDWVKRYPVVQSAAEARLRAQMENPVYNRDFESLDRLDEIVQAFPSLRDCAETVLARMIKNPMRSGDGSTAGKPNIELAKKIASRFKNMTTEVEAVIEEALRGTLVKWDHKELAELKMIFPNLEPAAAETLARDLNSGMKEYNIDELLKYARQFPSIKDHCADLVLVQVKNPATRIELKKLMEIAWRFPSVADELEKDIKNAINQIIDRRYYFQYDDYHYGRLIEFLCSLMREYPDHEELIRGVIYERIERVVEHSDATSLKEWVSNFDPGYDDRVAKALAKKGIEMPRDDKDLPGVEVATRPGRDAEEGDIESPTVGEPTIKYETNDAQTGSDTVLTSIPAEEEVKPSGNAPPVGEASAMTWKEYSFHVLKTRWREISVGALAIVLFLFTWWFVRRLKRWRKRVWEERDARHSKSTLTLWDRVMYFVWRRKPGSGKPAVEPTTTVDETVQAGEPSVAGG
jgi:hypothetical protein